MKELGDNNKIKILISPKPYKANDYIKNIVDTLSKKYDINSTYKNFILEVLFSKYDYVYLNWIENIYRSNNLKSLTKRAAYNFILFYIKEVRKKKIIWTYHNKIPHNIKNFKNIILSRKFIKKMIEKYSDIIIIHSNYAYEYLKDNYDFPPNKVLFLPHGSYKNNIDYREVKKKLNSNLNLGFFGTISPYKNIEKILDIIKDKNLNFYLFGNPSSKQYKENLLKKYKRYNNIKFDFRFIDNQDLPKIFSIIDLLILNYDEQSFLHSGTAFLSFTLKTPIIAKKIGMFNDFEDKDFVFLYKKDEDLYNLIDYIEKNISKELIIKLGEKAFEYVSNNDWDEFLNNFENKIK